MANKLTPGMDYLKICNPIMKIRCDDDDPCSLLVKETTSTAGLKLTEDSF